MTKKEWHKNYNFSYKSKLIKKACHDAHIQLMISIQLVFKSNQVLLF